MTLLKYHSTNFNKFSFSASKKNKKMYADDSPSDFGALETMPLNIKVKEEKITPPASPTKNSEEAASLILSSIDNILDTALTAIKTEKDDEKKSVERIKSSNEILAELFQVFNSALPAETFTVDQTSESTTQSKKKKKHKKHKKKNKNEDDGSDEDEKISEKSHKHKKVKKEKKSKRKRSESENKEQKTIEKHKIKKEKLDEIIIKKEHESRSSSSRRKKSKDKDKDLTNLEMDMDEYEKKLLENAKKSSSEKGGLSTSSVRQHKSSKIVIKDLKNSAVYEETISQVKINEKEKQKKYLAHEDGELSPGESHSSSISLSDEETYLRNKYSRTLNRDRDRDSNRDRDNRSPPPSSSSSYYGTTSSRSDTRSSYRDRSRYYEKDYRSSYGNDRRDTGGRHSSYVRRRSRSRSRRRDNSEDRIDKKRLLEIARKNAILMLKNGTLPGTQNLAPDAKEKVLAKMRYGGTVFTLVFGKS